jgi:hypothetical protein
MEFRLLKRFCAGKSKLEGAVIPDMGIHPNPGNVGVSSVFPVNAPRRNVAPVPYRELGVETEIARNDRFSI